jgi:arabinogalactan endo-1,4-beta-galactosidase
MTIAPIGAVLAATLAVPASAHAAGRTPLVDLALTASADHGAGIFYWQPEWIPGVGWAPGEGTPNDNLTLFDFKGHALPSIDFTDPVRR